MNRERDIVITMGGRGLRFRERGYHLPKYMIEVNGKTLFEWSMKSLEGYKDIVSQYIFVVMEEKEREAVDFIKEKCIELGIQTYRIITITINEQICL